MNDYGCVRCMFCETGKELSIVRAIQANGWGRAIFARCVRYVKRSGTWKQVKAPLLPGYVFLYSDGQEVHTLDLRRIPHVIRVLRYENGLEALMGSDLKFADWLWRMNGEIGVIQTVRVGDHVEIADGVLRELHGKILHVNQRQRKVYVSLDTQSIPIHTWLAYEQVDKIDDGKKVLWK